jgi:hypothetical protein
MENYSDIIRQIISVGVPVETIVVLLMIPILASVIAITRHIVGFSTAGFYISMLFGLSFYFIGKDDFKGLVYGVPVSIIILLLSVIFRSATKKLRFHYLPRISLLISFLSISALAGVSVIAALTDGQVSLYNVFPVVVLIILAERYISILVRKNPQVVTMRFAESIVFGSLSYLVLSWKWLQNLLLQSPEVVLIPIFISLLVAGTSQLRLTEFLRFKEVYKEKAPELEEKDRSEES